MSGSRGTWGKTNLLDLLLDLVERDVVSDDEGDLELLDTETDGNKGGGSPGETVLLDGSDSLLELSHVGLRMRGQDSSVLKAFGSKEKEGRRTSSSQGLTSMVTTDLPTAAGPLACFFSL